MKPNDTGMKRPRCSQVKGEILQRQTKGPGRVMKEIGGESGQVHRRAEVLVRLARFNYHVYRLHHKPSGRLLCAGSLGKAVQSSTSSRQYHSKAMIPPDGLSQRCSVAKSGRSWPLRVPVESTSLGTRGKQLRHWARMVS